MTNLVFDDRREKLLASEEASSCPWCFQQPAICAYHGGPRTKKLIACVNQDCPVQPDVTGNTRAKALEAWNTRREQ